jgi:hypothetical protein
VKSSVPILKNVRNPEHIGAVHAVIILAKRTIIRPNPVLTLGLGILTLIYGIPATTNIQTTLMIAEPIIIANASR